MANHVQCNTCMLVRKVSIWMYEGEVRLGEEEWEGNLKGNGDGDGEWRMGINSIPLSFPIISCIVFVCSDWLVC